MPKISLSDQTIDALIAGSKQEDFYDSNFKYKGSFGIRVGLGGKKTFFLLHSKNGKRIRITLGHFPNISYKSALKLANSTIEAENTDTKLIDNSGPPLSQVSALFLNKSSLDGLDKKTLKEYSRLLEREILPILGDLPVKKIKLGDIQNILVTIAYDRNRVPLSNRVRSLLGRIMNFSLEMGYRVRNPVSSSRPLIEKRGDSKLLLSDIRSLFEYCLKKDRVLTSAILLSILLLKDLRTVLRFRWSDLRGFTILFEQDDKIIEVPLTETMLNVIESQRRMASHHNMYIFNSRRKGQIKFFEKSLNKLGLDSASSPHLTSSSLHKSTHFIVKALLSESKADPELLNVYNSISKNSAVPPKSYISLLLKWEYLLRGESNNFSVARSTKATGQLIMIPQSWWKK